MREQWFVVDENDKLIGYAYGNTEEAAKGYYRRYGDKRRKLSKLSFAHNPGNATNIRGKV